MSYKLRNKYNMKLYGIYKKVLLPKERRLFKLNNKKKIRNWPALIKRLDALTNKHKVSNISEEVFHKMLFENGYLSMELNIDPFDRLTKRNLPVWYKRLFVASMLEVYNDWKKFAEKLNDSHYLKVWVFEPNFYKSQVVIAVKDSIKWYENLFEPNNDVISFPHEKYKNTYFKTEDLDWEIKKEVSMYDENEFKELEDLDPKYFNSIKNSGRVSYKYNETLNQQVFLVDEGNVWVGGEA